MTEIGLTAQRAQQRAADPAGSVWVAANAGSGKTRVLTERVARLLLEGAPPQKILCLTYTKAAAAEMQSRLFDKLGGWAMMEEAELRTQLQTLGGGDPNIDLTQARRLFAEALETPGGLKIQTIHAFCDSLLRRFPIEAGAPPTFRTVEDREQKALIAEILDEMADSQSFQDIAALLNEDALSDLARDIIGKRARFSADFDEPTIAKAFAVTAPFDEDAARAAAIDALDDQALLSMIAAFAVGTEKEQVKATTLRGALQVKGAVLANAMIGAFLKKDGVPLVNQATKKAKEAEPNWAAFTDHLIDIAIEARERALAASAAERAARLARFGVDLVQRYEARKAEAALLDFDDLVMRTKALLTSSSMAQWALYRLDGGVDHILVDEAQDTSPDQWAVIRAIAEEFHAGEGARDGGRTLFVVGDEKQSIYSFQGAAPGEFDRMRRHFNDRFKAAETPMRQEALAASFRSAPAILTAVDATFEGAAAAGLSAAGEPVSHLAFHQARAGRVDLWPLVEPDADAPDPDAWSPVDMPAAREPRVRLAGLVADHIADLLETGATLPGQGRAITPGDIIILLQRRNPMMPPLIRGLKRRGVPVAGADRLMLMDELAVKDLLALLRFVATPDDDLTLAALLRSPLFDVDEQALFALAHGRKGTLWQVLRDASDIHPREVRILRGFRGGEGYKRPYEVLERALSEEGGRQRMIARLGAEAEDPIDELLAQALAYEQVEPPSLEGFLGWMARGEEEIKRDQEGAAGQVRVMTAHGAKGLEAPVVILPDTIRAKRDDKSRVAKVDMAGQPAAAWKGVSGAEPRLLAEARQKAAAAQEEEQRRLLYVAMTRAEDWLIVCGAAPGRQGDLSDSWYGLVEAGMNRLDTIETPPPGDLTGVSRSYQSGVIPREGELEAPPVIGATPLPDWARRSPGSAHQTRIIRASASGLGGHEAGVGGGYAPEIARQRGEAIHAVLELNVTEATESHALIRSVAPDLPDSLVASTAVEAEQARAAPGVADYFAPDALAEVAVSLAVKGARIVGRIDRVIIGETTVRLVDFKSDAAPPAKGAAPPEGYLAQLAVYRAALAGIYTDKDVIAEILWTAAPRLDRIESSLLDKALADLPKQL